MRLPDAISRANRAMLVIGCLLYVGSAPLLTIVFVISCSLDRTVDQGTWDWWTAVLQTMFQPADFRPATIVLLAGSALGFVLMVRGLWLSVGGIRITTGRMMIVVLIAAFGFACVPLGILFLLFAPVVLTFSVLVRSPAPSAGDDARTVR